MGSVSALHWPYISLFTFSQSVAIQKIINYNWAGLQKNCGIAFISCRLCLDFVDCIWIVQLPVLVQWGVVLPIHSPAPCDKKVVPKRILSIAFGLFRLYLDYVDYIWIVLIVCRPTTLVRRQAGVQECIKGYTWLVWSKVELCRVQIAHQSCWLSWNCVDHRDFAKHQTCLIPFDILLIPEKRAMSYFHTSDTDTINSRPRPP